MMILLVHPQLVGAINCSQLMDGYELLTMTFIASLPQFSNFSDAFQASGDCEDKEKRVPQVV